MGGKDLLIEAVAQVIHVFVTTISNIPKNICKEITNSISQLWWGDDDDHKRMHWLTWGKCVWQKIEEVWVSMVPTLSTLLCLLNSVGDLLWRIESLYVQVLGPDIIRKVIFQKLSSKVVVSLPGKYFL
jgi:hypothetical protein